MTRAGLCLALMLGAVGCARVPSVFISSKAIAPDYRPVPAAAVRIGPTLGEQDYEEIGVITVWVERERDRDERLRAAAAERGAHALVDIEAVTKAPRALLFGAMPVGSRVCYAATLIRWIDP